jgi:FemAB-related protein (PEP-CTERM system-associated)
LKLPAAVQPLAADPDRQWDKYVEAHAHGTPFHLLAWKRSIEETFGYRPCYLVARRGDAICGVLPLFLVSNRILGKALISTPFAVYGGVLADDDETRAALVAEARRLGESLDVEHVELRNVHPDQTSGLPRIDRYVTFSQATVDNEAALLESLPKKTRNMVRKALKFPYTSRRADGWRAFYDLYSRNLRRLGTPSFSPGHFERLLANFGDLVDIREVLLEDKVIAASFNFYFRGQMHTYYAASDYRRLAQAPNNFLYYDHLLWAGRNGFPIFDFGRSKKNTGTVDFKKHWNTEMRELPYEVILVRRRELPNFSPANPKFDMAIRIWRRLPLFVTRALGPKLVRLFP